MGWKISPPPHKTKKMILNTIKAGKQDLDSFCLDIAAIFHFLSDLTPLKREHVIIHYSLICFRCFAWKNYCLMICHKVSSKRQAEDMIQAIKHLSDIYYWISNDLIDTEREKVDILDTKNNSFLF